MGRKRKLKMTVKIVPPGTLRPNLRNPHAKETAQQRREGMLRALVRGLVAADRQPNASHSEPTLGAATS